MISIFKGSSDGAQDGIPVDFALCVCSTTSLRIPQDPRQDLPARTRRSEALLHPGPKHTGPLYRDPPSDSLLASVMAQFSAGARR